MASVLNQPQATADVYCIWVSTAYGCLLCMGVYCVQVSTALNLKRFTFLKTAHRVAVYWINSKKVDRLKKQAFKRIEENSVSKNILTTPWKRIHGSCKPSKAGADAECTGKYVQGVCNSRTFCSNCIVVASIKRMTQYISIMFLCSFTSIASAKSDNFQNANHQFQQAANAFHQGRYTEAIQAWQRLVSTLADTSDLADSSLANTSSKDSLGWQVRAQLGIVAASQAMGLYSRGLQALEYARAVLESVDDPILWIQWFNHRGNLALSMGREQQALDSFEQAKALLAINPNPEIQANVLNHYANLLFTQGEINKALETYQQALQLAEKHHYYEEAILTRLNRLRLQLSLPASNKPQNLKASITDLAQAIQRLPSGYNNQNQNQNHSHNHSHNHNHSHSHNQARHWTTLSLLTLDYQEKQATHIFANAIYQWLQSAKAQMQQQKDDAGLSYIAGYEGRLYAQQKRYHEARYLTQKALFLARQEHLVDSLYQWYRQLGSIYKAEGDTHAAISAYRQALEALKPIREEITQGYRLDPRFVQRNIRPVYIELAELLLEQAHQLTGLTTETDRTETDRLADTRSKSRTRLLREAQSVIETLRTVELEDYFRDECVLETEEKRIPLNTLSPNTAVIYPVILSEQLALLVEIEGELSYQRIDIQAEIVSNTIYRFIQGLKTFYKTDYQKDARKLYQWFIQPLESQLQQQAIDTLVIIPGGALRMIPFAALHDGQQFLIEQYALANNPSLTLTASQPLAKSVKNVLLAGLSEGVQNFSPLPAGHEIGCISTYCQALPY